MKAALRPIFIVGAPGFGTTWLLSLLERHPQCRAITPDTLGIIPTRVTKESGAFLRGLSSREIVECFSRLPTDRVLVDTTPEHLLQVGRIKRVFPGARIVLVRRSPPDLIWSMIQANSSWEGNLKSLGEAVAFYNTFAKAQEIYVGYDAVIDYEALWGNPVEELARLLTLLGLDPSPASELVANTFEGKLLPEKLSGVFRKEMPGEGEAHFSDADRAYLQKHLYVPDRLPRQLAILLTTNHLFGWTGSETLLLTLIESLLERGCRLTVYSRHWNPEWLDHHFDHRVRLTDNLETVSQQYFDLSHVQHNSCLVDVRAAFPSLPVIFSSLGVLPFLEQPIPFDVGVSHYLAISEEVADNLTVHGVPKQKIHIVRNMVSGERFFPINTIGQQPERILVFSYKMDEGRKTLLREAAVRIGAAIRFAGGSSDTIPHDRLCEAINEADIVVTLGRGVVETMLCGRVPMVFDIHGGDGLVTPDNFQNLCMFNFSGRRYGWEYTVDDLVGEFAKYHQEYGVRLRELALSHFGAEQNVSRLIELYGAVASKTEHMHLPEYMPAMLSFFSALAREDREDLQQAKRLSDTELRLLAIQNTISWRVTAPLRVGWNLYRRLIDKMMKMNAGEK